MPSEIRARVEKAIQEKVFPGCVVGIIRANGGREILPFGRFTYENDSPEVEADMIYDLASITKSIPTASLAAMLIKEGKLLPTDMIKKYILELQNDHGATIEDLLTYRVQGVQLSKLRHSTFEEIRTHALEHGFDGPPGESVYTNLPAFFLGIIIERVGESILPALAQKYFFDPLHMADTTFFPHDLSRVVPTEIDERGEVRGLPHDESAYTFAKARRAVGHAGLFSTAPDLLIFLEALMRGDFPWVVECAQKAWGWQANDSRFMGKYSTPQTFGKTGFTGTSVICDIERGVAFVILSNRTYPKRPGDDAAIFQFRADIADIMFEHV